MPYCSKCELDFDAEPWEDGSCPQCKRSFYWDEIVSEDFELDWPIAIFEDEKHLWNLK